MVAVREFFKSLTLESPAERWYCMPFVIQALTIDDASDLADAISVGAKKKFLVKDEEELTVLVEAGTSLQSARGTVDWCLRHPVKELTLNFWQVPRLKKSPALSFEDALAQATDFQVGKSIEGSTSVASRTLSTALLSGVIRDNLNADPEFQLFIDVLDPKLKWCRVIDIRNHRFFKDIANSVLSQGE